MKFFRNKFFVLLALKNEINYCVLLILKMPNYPCPNCERVFSRRASLRNHVKTHDNEIDRVLREISEDVVEEMNIHEQMETSDDELIDDANDD